MQVFVRFDAHRAGGRVDRPTVGAEQPPEEGEERGQKEQRIAARQASRTQPQRLVVEIVEEKVERQHPRKGEDGYSQQQIACVRQRFETVPRRRPLRYGRVAAHGGHVHAVDGELRAGEECAHGDAQQQRPRHAVEYQKGLVGALAEYVGRFAAVFVGDGLHDEDQQNGHPDVECAAERCRVE